MSHVLGIDFGTSNSAAGTLSDGKPRLIEMAPGRVTLPTTFFFDFETRQTLMGDPANQALLAGVDGRFMRALKRILGTPLMHEKRQILNERVTFVTIIARFLKHLKQRAEEETGQTFSTAVSGRPVVFHRTGDAREAQAEADLRQCYQHAGFEQVHFIAEPEAAALASGANDLPQGALGLIVDVGGGTSDFSLFRNAERGIDILANHGVRIGGTDFDRAISFEWAMPNLGKGDLLRKTMGSGTSPVPVAIYNDLATWEKIPFLYTAKTRRMVEEMIALAKAPERLTRLGRVLEHELGHDLAFAVETAKIQTNGKTGAATVSLDQIERGMHFTLSPENVTISLQTYADRLRQAAIDTLDPVEVPLRNVDKVIYVGGSSLMGVVQETMHDLLPNADHHVADVFTAVANGLTLATRRYT